MITTYLRSSSLGDFEMCQLKFYLGYVLGMRFPSNAAANVGTTVHKALELLALRKFNEQQNISSFTEKETGKTFNTVELLPEVAVEVAWNHYKDEFKFQSKHYEEIKIHFWDLLKYRNGIFSPLKREILHHEMFFDIEITEPWGHYSFKLGNETIEGNLRLKGTIDLITLVDEKTIEVIDYKTGRDVSWNDNERKDYKKLRKDIQLSLYFYVLDKLYPDYYKILTLFYTSRWDAKKDTVQGPRSIDFHKEDVPEIEKTLRGYFEKIVATQIPSRVAGSFKCRFCPFSKNQWEDTGKTYCDFFHQKIRKDGLQKTTESFIIKEAMNSYEGGGKTIKETE